MQDERSIAVKLAADTADRASALAITTANTAATLASKTSESMAIISTDISWMKKSLLGIEETLKGMVGLYATTKDFEEFKVQADDRETRIRDIEKNMWRWLGIASVMSAILTMGIGYALNKI